MDREALMQELEQIELEHNTFWHWQANRPYDEAFVESWRKELEDMLRALAQRLGATDLDWLEREELEEWALRLSVFCPGDDTRVRAERWAARSADEAGRLAKRILAGQRD